MVMALQSLNGGTANADGQLGLYRSRLQQARREADQAENRVAQLEQQAQTARNEAARANDRVRAAESNPPPTGSRAGSAPREAFGPTLNTLGQLNGRLLNAQA
jgi:septal ring factor EnvC (AmiA/AmiB activator)